ncbi:MAG: tRNA pseudouridine(38-40) synthase TruA [Kiritimatiellia bacterium]|jgi:tRNA pseudouridine38-40 synthase
MTELPTNLPARRFKLTIAYDGTGYAGWQVQPGEATVQDEIEKALLAIVGHPCKVHGSGRTDAGVHARGQVAHVDLHTRMDAKAVQRALNARLPQDIRILSAARAKADFHARRSARAKEYRYTVWAAPVMPPHLRLAAAHVYRMPDLAAMRDAARRFEGRHDFAAFTANPRREVETTVRTVFSCRVTCSGRRITIAVRGEGFLYRQVRSMAGFLLRVGSGAEPPEAVDALLDARAPRTARVPSAPACGLALWRVWYGPERRAAASQDKTEG